MLYEPGCSFASNLGTYVNNEQNSFMDFWGLQNEDETPELSEEDREVFRKLEFAGGAYDTSIFSLSANAKLLGALRFVRRDGEELSEPELRDVARVLPLHPVVRDRIHVALAWEATEALLGSAEERLGEILGMLAVRKLSERAQAFVDRATRLFLWGFDAESVVMCHSSVEVALSDLLPDERMWSLGFTKKEHQRDYTARQYERAAVAADLLTPKQGRTAAEIRQARNDTVHGAPNISRSAGRVLRDTIELLDALFPPNSGPSR